MTSKKGRRAEAVRLINPIGIEVTVSAGSVENYVSKGYKRVSVKEPKAVEKQD